MGLHVQEAHLKAWIWSECENVISAVCSLWAGSLLFCSNLDFTTDTLPSTGLTKPWQEVVCVALPPSDTHLLTKQTPCFSRIKACYFLIGVALVTCLCLAAREAGRCLSPGEENGMNRNWVAGCDNGVPEYQTLGEHQNVLMCPPGSFPRQTPLLEFHLLCPQQGKCSCWTGF